jgi:archaellum component FlaF (FlaF/FlaG flagellin family)
MKRAKIPRFTRSVEIIINMPEAARPSTRPVPLQSKLTRWDRAKGAGKVIGALLVALTSIAAIIVSSLALSEQKTADREQQQVNTAAAAASQRHEAEQVSFIQDEGSEASKLPVEITNLGTSSVRNPVLGVIINGFLIPPEINGKLNTVDMLVYLELNDIPACSSATVYIAQALTTVLKYDEEGVEPILPSQLLKLTTQEISHLVPHAIVFDLTFIDGNGYWRYLTTDTLTQVPSSDSQGGASPTLVSATYKKATGCT